MLSRIFIAVIALSLVGCSDPGLDEIYAGEPPFTQLTFADEFDGPEIDDTLWRVADEHEDAFPESKWRRNYKAENVYIEDGALVIRVQREDVGFSTGSVATGYYDEVSRFEQAYGRFEARVQFPTQQGHWPAFWLWNTTQGTPGDEGRNGSEIDVFEKPWLIDRAQHALNWDGYGEDRGIAHQKIEGMGLDDGGWHTFRLDWYPDEYVFFVDGVETWRTDVDGVCQVPDYILITDEIGNFGVGPDEWGVGPIDDADLPDYFRIDYVRVWAYTPE
jgi:beta-glucanase (GH16 family)